MNTKDLVNKVATTHNLPKTEAKLVVDTVFDTITTEVKKGHDVRLSGFGVFERRARKARAGRNPQTGATVQIPASKYPKFRPGTEFRSAVNVSK